MLEKFELSFQNICISDNIIKNLHLTLGTVDQVSENFSYKLIKFEFPRPEKQSVSYSKY